MTAYRRGMTYDLRAVHQAQLWAQRSVTSMGDICLYFVLIFHRRTRTAYLYNGHLAWYNVLITSQIHSRVKTQFPNVRETKYTTVRLLNAASTLCHTVLRILLMGLKYCLLIC